MVSALFLGRRIPSTLTLLHQGGGEKRTLLDHGR
jgi:hypothetical protein